MDENRLEALMDGAEPSLQDLGCFVALTEKLPTAMLWQMVHVSRLHPFLQKVVLNQLEEKLPRESLDADLDRLTTKLSHLLKPGT